MSLKLSLPHCLPYFLTIKALCEKYACYIEVLLKLEYVRIHDEQSEDVFSELTRVGQSYGHPRHHCFEITCNLTRIYIHEMASRLKGDHPSDIIIMASLVICFRTDMSSVKVVVAFSAIN